MKIALVSLNQLWEDKSSNINQISRLMLEIIKEGPDLVVFPEMTLTGFTMNGKNLAEMFDNSATLNYFKELAHLHEVDIAFGMIELHDMMPTNNLVVVTKHSQVLLNYAKMHPFSYSNEDQYYLKGHELGLFNYNDEVWGGTVCYDLRFPELYQALSKKAKVILNIANWPKRRVDDWRLLLHARALENQCFMIGVNRTGTDGKGLEYESSSMIIRPDGKDLEPVKTDGMVKFYEVDIREVDKYRQSFPVKKDRRIDLYKELL